MIFTILNPPRVGPSIPIFNKVKGLIDAGADEDAILAQYKDPHIYTAMIKSVNFTHPQGFCFYQKQKKNNAPATLT